jgi:hypothetical protein
MDGSANKDTLHDYTTTDAVIELFDNGSSLSTSVKRTKVAKVFAVPFATRARKYRAPDGMCSAIISIVFISPCVTFAVAPAVAVPPERVAHVGTPPEV